MHNMPDPIYLQLLARLVGHSLKILIEKREDLQKALVLWGSPAEILETERALTENAQAINAELLRFRNLPPMWSLVVASQA